MGLRAVDEEHGKRRYGLQSIDIALFILLSRHPSRTGCHQAVIAESQPVLSQCEPEGVAMLTQSQPKAALSSSRAADVIKSPQLPPHANRGA